jgi:alkyl hydroperoxide reductase subunit AhpC
VSLLLPVVIAFGCFAVWLVVRWLSRPRPSLADVDVPGTKAAPGGKAAGATAQAGAPERAALERWHRANEQPVLDYLAVHERALLVDGEEHDELIALEESVLERAATHPHVVARAEMVALTAAARATRQARRRHDAEVAERQHAAYLDYRRTWLDRLWQFRTDRERVLALSRATPAVLPIAAGDSDPGRCGIVATGVGSQGSASSPDDRNDDRKEEPDMTLRLGDIAPDFQADTTEGPISFHQWKEGSWAVLFSHPRDFTPVCTTELGYTAKLKDEFAARNVKVIGLSVDSVEDHHRWVGDIEETQGQAVNFPMIGDPDRAVATLFDMIHPNADDTFTVRSVFVIDPSNKVRLTITYPASTGRNFDEVLRVIDSMQLTDAHKVATPVNWKQGDDVIIVPALSNEQAAELFPDGWDEQKPYLRVVKQPS